MILSAAQEKSVMEVLRCANALSVAGGYPETQLTLLALTLVYACRRCGVERDTALAVLCGLFDEDPQSMMLMPPASNAVH